MLPNLLAEADSMATHRVNLDALIQRQDFEAGTTAASTQDREPIFKLEELERRRVYFSVLRKPDFQRTTNNWSPEMIVNFVQSFLDDELIPSIIIWHSKDTGKVFVIDGAHRVSALIAWVNDDYGNGPLSKAFFGEGIPSAQKKFDKETRELMEERVGRFTELLEQAANPPTGEETLKLRRGRAIATRIPDLQRVQGGAEVAQKSFLTINGNPAIIDPTELDIIKARRKPNAIATRALMQAGKGYKYWERFGENGNKISELAAEVYDLMFGEIVEISAQSPDVPRAGQPYSAEAFRMSLDLVNIFNGVTDVMWKEPKTRGGKPKKTDWKPSLQDDADGSATLAFLDSVKDVGRFAFDPSLAGSLGLDPAVYCWGPEKFYTSAYLAALKFAMELKSQNKLFEFTEARKQFEDFLVNYKSFIKDISHGKGSRTRPLETLLTLHRTIFSYIQGGQGEWDIINQLGDLPAFKNTLKFPESDPEPSFDGPEPKKRKRKSFPKSVQQAAVLRSILETRERCTECGARLAPFSRSKDHVDPKSTGGDSTLENLQFTHPYCNTGYKQKKLHLARMATNKSI